MLRGFALFSVGVQLAVGALVCDPGIPGATPEQKVWLNNLLQAGTFDTDGVGYKYAIPLVADADARSGCVPCSGASTPPGCPATGFATSQVCTEEDTNSGQVLCDWVFGTVDAAPETAKDVKPTAYPTTKSDPASSPNVAEFTACYTAGIKLTKKTCNQDGKCACSSGYTLPDEGPCETLKTKLNDMGKANAKGHTIFGKLTKEWGTSAIVPPKPPTPADPSFLQMATGTGVWCAVTGVALAFPALGYATYKLGPKFFEHAETEEAQEATVQSKQEGRHEQMQPTQTLTEPAFAAGVVALVILGAMLVLVSLGGGKKGARQEEDISDEEDRA